MNLSYLFQRKIKASFNIIFHSNFSLEYPKKSDLVLFDDNLSEFLDKYFKEKYTILHARQKKYNLRIVLKVLLKNKLRFTSLDYFNEYIKYVNPKIILTFSDNTPNYYKIIKNHKTKKIFIQNAYRTSTQQDIFFQSKLLEKTKKNQNVDHMLVFNEKIGKLYEKFINGKHTVIGSFRSNCYKKVKGNNFDLFFISTWRDHALDFPITDSIPWKKFLDTQAKLIKYIYEYTKKNNRHLTIYGKYKEDKEKEFFIKVLGKENRYWKYLTNTRDNSYNNLDKSKLVISSISSLGYECLARDTKVAFFNVYNFNKSTESKKFGWPYDLPKNGPFWTNELSQKSCNKFLSQVSKIKRNKWHNLKKKYSYLLKYDKNNKIFVKLVNKILKSQ